MSDSKFNFGAIDPITNGIGMFYNIGSGIADQVRNRENDKWNKEFAEKQFSYQQDLNRQVMEREDNAVQRRAADMKAAGISKNLAAGSSAQAQVMSSGSSGAVAETGFSAKQLQANELNIMNSYQSYKMNEAQTTLINQQAINEAVKEGLLEEEKGKLKTEQNLNKANMLKTNEETKILKHNRELSEKYGIRINDILDTKYNTLKAMVVDAVKEEGLIHSSVRSFDDIAKGILQVDKALQKVNDNIYKKIVKDENHWLRRYIKFSEKPSHEQIDILIKKFLKGK